MGYQRGKDLKPKTGGIYPARNPKEILPKSGYGTSIWRKLKNNRPYQTQTPKTNLGTGGNKES